jgi:CubicO group peptidase (beta-lactamase class C family)
MLERVELEAWLDGYMGWALRAGNVAGAVVVVVKDSIILLEKGYGFADVAGRVPVDPERTGFRPGSVSKLITATAVMQLVEQGKLDLDRDVNAYLDFTLPAAFGTSITLRHALTHTPGLGYVVKGIGTDDPGKVETLEYHVKHHVPPRIYRPGTIPAYSNYGFGLAGYIVQRVSGEQLEDYVERHVFQPLGMRRSTFVQPVPESLRGDVSKGYLTAGGAPQPFEILGTVAAGGMTSTGADMARFMIAHLNDGHLGSAQILRPETVRLMHHRALPDFPELNGMDLGFRESSRNGHRIIGHGGDTRVFHADLELYPDDKVGLYVAFNSLGTGPLDSNELIGALVDAFTDRYFPGPPPVDPPAVPTAVAHAHLAAGRYLSARHFERSFLSLLSLLQVQVSANADGTITISSEERPDGRLKVWRETAPFLWQEVGGQDRLGMIVEDGRVVAIRRSSDPATALVRAPWWMSPAWIFPALIAAVVVLMLAVLAWPVSVIVRRTQKTAGAEARSGWLAWLAAVVGLGFLLGWALILRRVLAGEAVFLGELDPQIRFQHLLGLGTVAGAVVAAWAAWRTVRSRRRWPVKLWSVLLAGACTMVVWLAFAFRLLTRSLEY